MQVESTLLKIKRARKLASLNYEFVLEAAMDAIFG